MWNSLGTAADLHVAADDRNLHHDPEEHVRQAGEAVVAMLSQVLPRHNTQPKHGDGIHYSCHIAVLSQVLPRHYTQPTHGEGIH